MSYISPKYDILEIFLWRLKNKLWITREGLDRRQLLDDFISSEGQIAIESKMVAIWPVTTICDHGTQIFVHHTTVNW